MKRALYLPLAIIMLALGVVGIALPLLPSTPFLLAALWLFTRCSPKAEAWLLGHSVLGKPLRDWRKERAISRRHKGAALACMAASYVAFLYTTAPDLPLALLVAGILLAAAAFIVTRPVPRSEVGPRG